MDFGRGAQEAQAFTSYLRPLTAASFLFRFFKPSLILFFIFVYLTYSPVFVCSMATSPHTLPPPHPRPSIAGQGRSSRAEAAQQPHCPERAAKRRGASR